MTRLLILGAGRVGGALGRAWLAAGHDVRFGVPDPASGKYADLPRGRLQPPAERRGAEIVVLALPFGAAKGAIAALGDLSGATLIDCTNAVGPGDGGLRLLYGHDTSAAEQIAAMAPGASVFKALNQTGAENLADVQAFAERPVMFVAGDDGAKKPSVLALVSDIGFEAVDAGPLSAARLLEPLALLWIRLSMTSPGGRERAFALIRRRGE